jgi:pimeloyl-ACP methyl ester carboxylesterase
MRSREANIDTIGGHAPERPLTVPTRLLFGAQNVALSPAQLAGGDGLRIKVVEGCGHHLPDERPDLVAAAVREMLESRTTRDAR